MSDPSVPPVRFTKVDFLLSIIGAIAWGLSLIGVVTNLLLGSAVLVAALGVVSYEFLKWSKSKGWPAILRVITVVVVGALVIWSGGRQVVRQYHQEHAGDIAAVPSPQPTKAATSLPSALPSPSLIQQLGSDETKNQNDKSGKNNENAIEANQQNVKVWPDQTGSVFGGDIRIGLIGIHFEGDPLHHTVDATISSPGRKSLTIRHREKNDPVKYTGRVDYEINVLTTDTYWVIFQVTRNPAATRSLGKPQSRSRNTRHKAAIDALLDKPQ